MAAFRKKYPKGKAYVVSYQDDPSGLAIPMEQFLITKPDLLCSKQVYSDDSSKFSGLLYNNVASVLH